MTRCARQPIGEQMFEGHVHSEVEQLVARLVHTQQVVGSSPTLATPITFEVRS